MSLEWQEGTRPRCNSLLLALGNLLDNSASGRRATAGIFRNSSLLRPQGGGRRRDVQAARAGIAYLWGWSGAAPPTAGLMAAPRGP